MTPKTNNWPWFALAAAVAVPCVPSVAFAQDTLEEIVVTAQRREQSLQDVPLSVTAFTAGDLEKSNISEARDYLALSPNVSFSEDGEAGNRSINISIRGVGNVDLGEVSTANSIGYYVDELNVGSVSNGTINPQLQDMERIEVLRGPQGTYFGRNALGGAINITTIKPNQEHYGELTARAGNFGALGVQAIGNLPISDTFMVRAVLAYDESDGMVRNVNPNGAPNSGFEYFTGRVSLRFLPSDNVTVDLSITHTDEDEGHDGGVGSGVVDLDTQSIFGATFVPIDDQLGFFPGNQRLVNHNTPEINENSFTIVNGRVSWTVGDYEFKSITGIVNSETDRVFDQDNISADAIIRFNDYEGDSFSQEFRVLSTVSETMTWTAGIFYAKDEIEQFNSIQAGSEGSYTNPVTGEVIGLLPPIPAGFRINENNRVFETSSLAVFGEATFDVSDQLSVSLGARYTKDDIDNRSFGVVAFEGSVPDASGSDSFSNFSPRLVARYAATDDTNIYGSVSRGYKAGGVDLGNGLVTAFEPEELTNYEVGFKSELNDGRTRLSAALFYLDWEDLQVQTNFLAIPGDISSAVERTLNAGAASSSGFEVELTTLLTENLTLAVAGGYINSEFDSFANAILAGGNAVDLTGSDLPNTPDVTASAVLDYGFDLGGNDAFARLEINHRSSAAGDLEGLAAPQLGLPDFPYQIDSYTVANLRAGVDLGSLRFNAFVENLFDEEYYNGTSDNFGLAGIRIRPHPRIYGLSVSYRFGEY
nr:iron and copper transporter IacT-like [Nerophis lumbriciformis]